MSPAQIASWSLTPELPDLPGTFVDVLELTEDDLRWLRERPTDPDLKMADDVTQAVDDVLAEGSAQGSVQGFPGDGAAPAVEATPPVDASVPASASEPFWATPGVTPPSVPDAVSSRVTVVQDAVGALLAGGAVSGSRADTEALLRLAEQAQTAALAELAEMDAALIARDRRCIVKGCHRPPAACEAHHVQGWANGGGTHLDNMVLLCHAHHHDLHDRAQQLPHHDGTRWLTETGWAHDPP